MILFLPFLMLSAVMAFAEPKAIQEADSTLEILNIDEISEPKALLWSVSGNGLTAPSYIYGTIHLICPDDFKISATLKEKIKEANSYISLCEKKLRQIELEVKAIQDENGTKSRSKKKE